MKDFNIITELDKKKWSDFIYNHPNGNIFQTPEMFEVYKNTKNWEPLFLAIVDNNENILGVLLCVIQKEAPKLLGLLTARAIVWGGPLIASMQQSTELIVHLLKAVDGLLKDKVIYIQFRNLFSFSLDKNKFIDNGYKTEEHLNFLADLTQGEDFLWNNLESSKRRAIKKAINEKVEIKILQERFQIEESYKILQLFYKRIRIPLPDKSFFESIFQILAPKDMVKIFLGHYKEKIIGVLYLFTYKETATIGYTTSLSEYQNKRPNDFLYWEAIKWSSQNHYKIFDFGGAGSPYREYGVRRFKQGFSGESVNYGRFIKTYRPTIMRIVNTGILVLRKTCGLS